MNSIPDEYEAFALKSLCGGCFAYSWWTCFEQCHITRRNESGHQHFIAERIPWETDNQTKSEQDLNQHCKNEFLPSFSKLKHQLLYGQGKPDPEHLHAINGLRCNKWTQVSPVAVWHWSILSSLLPNVSSLQWLLRRSSDSVQMITEQDP